MTRYLLRVSFCVGQLGGHVEHNLLIMETCVHRFCPRLPMSDIQASSKPGGEKNKRRDWGPEQEEQREQDCAAQKGGGGGRGGDWHQPLCGRQKSSIRSGSILRAAGQSTLIHLLWTDKGICLLHQSLWPFLPQISGHSKVFLFFSFQKGTVWSSVWSIAKCPTECVWWIHDGSMMECFGKDLPKKLKVRWPTATKPFKVMKLNPVTQKLQELDKGRTFFHVPKEFFFCSLQGGMKKKINRFLRTRAWLEQGNHQNLTHLSELLINNSKLEVVADHVLIKRDNQPWRLIGTSKVLSQHSLTLPRIRR